MSGQLDDLVARVRAQTQEARALASSDPQGFERRPSEDRWSAAEHLAHLSLTGRPYLGVIGAALTDARAGGRLSDGPFRGGALGNWFARMMSPPVKRRMKTMPKLVPAEGLTGDEALADFEAFQRELTESLEAARGVDLDAARMRSPFLAILRMPLFSAYRVLLEHADRHLWLATQRPAR
jgi:DinB superfamily